MRHKKAYKYVILLFFLTILTEHWIIKLVSDSRLERLSNETVIKQEFRDQEIGEELLEYVMDSRMPATEIGLYLLETKFGYQEFQGSLSEETFTMLKHKWSKQEGWTVYQTTMKSIWNDLKYFPIPESTIDSKMQVTYGNSWMAERTYGGKRGHEGTDIMASQNVAGVYPVVSMTDGIVRSKGWLEKGGYRIGIEAPSGAYFYYAHLDSYTSIEIGDKIVAGNLLGFMGDTGYGVEGTTGKFPVHLHVGVYIYPEEKELSINPYWLLRYLEKQRVKCAYLYISQ